MTSTDNMVGTERRQAWMRAPRADGRVRVSAPDTEFGIFATSFERGLRTPSPERDRLAALASGGVFS